MTHRSWTRGFLRRLGRSVALAAALAIAPGCYLSDDEGGRTRRQMDEEFHSSSGSEWSDPRRECDEPGDPACSGGDEATRCGAGYPACPDGQRCVDDPARACRTASDPTCPGLCK